MNAVVGALRTVIARARFALWLLAAALGGSVAMAQTTEAPKPAVKTPKKAKEKQPQPPAPQQPAAAAPPPGPAIIYSPWTKICPKEAPKPICLIVKEARLETGQFLAGAALIEQQGEAKKLLRITLPLGMQLSPGTRLTLDSEQPASAVYVTCIPNGCMADFEINAQYIERMKKGQQIMLQGVNMQGQVASYALPLSDFGKAVDGAPTDPEEFGQRQKAEWEKRLKANPQANAPPAAPPK